MADNHKYDGAMVAIPEEQLQIDWYQSPLRLAALPSSLALPQNLCCQKISVEPNLAGEQ